MKIVHESLDKDSVVKTLYDASKELGLLKIVLSDGTTMRINEQIVDAKSYFDVNLSSSKDGAFTIHVLPRASNVVWIGSHVI